MLRTTNKTWCHNDSFCTPIDLLTCLFFIWLDLLYASSYAETLTSNVSIVYKLNPIANSLIVDMSKLEFTVEMSESAFHKVSAERPESFHLPAYNL